MKKLKVLIFLIGLVGVSASIFYHQRNSQGTVYGLVKRYSIANIADLKGNYVLLHFWAKWCEPCAEEIPLLVQFANGLEGRAVKQDGSGVLGGGAARMGIKILAVSLDANLEEAKQILPEKGTLLPKNFILALDSSHQFAEQMGSYQYPESYLIGPEGQIIEKWVGPQKWNKPDVLEYFSKYLR